MMIPDGELAKITANFTADSVDLSKSNQAMPIQLITK